MNWESTGRAAAVVIALCCLSAGCGGKSAGEAPDVPVVAEVLETASYEDLGSGPFCTRSSECPAGFCDKLTGRCVECFVEQHCPDGQVCASGSCVETQGCNETLNECDDLVCDLEAGHCVQCLEDSHCGAGKWCWNHVCRFKPEECADGGECQQGGAVCSSDKGLCLDCGIDSDCAWFEHCEEQACLPRPCTPGNPECLDDSLAKVCRTDGQGFFYLQCAQGEQCMQGICVEPHCTPGEYTCVNFAKSVCQLDPVAGELTYKTMPCPPAQVCIDKGCRPLRHRVLFVFDTSSSMNWLPQSEALPEMCPLGRQSTPENPCIGFYPNCEPKEAPFTKLGISKSVFENLMQSDEADTAFCALMRFPQVSKKGAPNCEGGWFEGQVWMTGHEPGQEHAVPEEPGNWFDANLAEVLLEPFPADHGSYVTWNVARWFNFIQVVENLGVSCADHAACGPGKWCLGPQPVCRQFDDPEIMASGWTPLGRTLFYAGEYVRRHVIVDGKECKTDKDCASAGYLCGPTGKCFDPLYDPDPAKTCRQNVIVLFTDGQETETLGHSFFHPAVQAKRFHFGLGCNTDADCLNNATCQEGSCYHPSLHAGTLPVVEYVEEDGAQTLLDRNGNPISLTIHVVDASGPDEINEFIAHHGGGEYYPVSMEDEVDFLKKLILTLDIKTLAQNCTVSDKR